MNTIHACENQEDIIKYHRNGSCLSDIHRNCERQDLHEAISIECFRSLILSCQHIICHVSITLLIYSGQRGQCKHSDGYTLVLLSYRRNAVKIFLNIKCFGKVIALLPVPGIIWQFRAKCLYVGVPFLWCFTVVSWYCILIVKYLSLEVWYYFDVVLATTSWYYYMVSHS